ncbi:hypothetical protein ACJ73_00745 [Blastomyces percursus]|uniref:Uncharacterized protein n=1 Tax=Blastomyces percursus TaxID=1658174 RepID=A0A1J9RH33_9EURO|nr:hypothetical protein ACJ73_00745 [Blastomyces percursus]
MSEIKHEEETLWENELRKSLVPKAPSSPAIHPPNTEYEQPNPCVDYNELSQFIRSNEGRIAPGDIAIFQELARHRHAYFSACRSFFKSHNTLRDLFAERCQLVKKWKDISQNLDKFTIESRRDMSSRVEIHERNCTAKKETHAARLREVIACTPSLAKTKRKAASVFHKFGILGLNPSIRGRKHQTLLTRPPKPIKVVAGLAL